MGFMRVWCEAEWKIYLILLYYEDEVKKSAYVHDVQVTSLDGV